MIVGLLFSIWAGLNQRRLSRNHDDAVARMDARASDLPARAANPGESSSIDVSYSEVEETKHDARSGWILLGVGLLVTVVAGATWRASPRRRA